MRTAERFLLLVLLLTGATIAPAQPPAPAPAPATDATAATDSAPREQPAAAAEPAGVAEPAAAADALPGTNTVAGNAPGERNDRITAGGSTFGVRVLPITGGPARGAMVLVPGDGRFPGTSRGIVALQTGMPRFGWSTWTPELESPPRAHSAALDPAAAAKDPETAAAADAKPAAEPPAPKAADADAQSDQPQPAAPPEPLPLEAQRAQELKEWATRGQQRLAAVVGAASAEGQVVVVAEGVGAALATGLAAQMPNGVHAFALLDPVELPGLAAEWPRGSATPVLEVLDPALGNSLATDRRARANASGLHYYRQIVVPIGEGTAPGAEPPLVRWLRGWLRSLEQRDAD